MRKVRLPHTLDTFPLKQEVLLFLKLGSRRGGRGWKGVEEGETERGWKRVKEGGRGWKRVEEGERG